MGAFETIRRRNLAKTIKHYGRVLAYVLVLAVFGQVLAMAQSAPNGTVSGVVTDTTGAVIPGVSISVKNVGTDVTRKATTDPSGHWTLPALTVGNYQISYEFDGFK